ncbi:DEAD/DEAH box helicase [Shewanella fidelis]|uniref:DEAD/DEAH box helicase n=1 Tax=Shewanella fidelis TaxID=173509 RepID=A0AAW8NPD8_9GAMM|nr:DEAD/DEAH box helicase [Shewanella fidelis]MDR8524225.1 DEAD/DEAH box helicase [Shewanella fidelis]MDW4810773.1 DEAD/DEAH box helicase [Shewanella fidelis]MDW4814894.1 DEAD/DEAH box helicase [Shewanella fidelis]MDW4818984.1 DEAD/DEAH box helicase [Shewanella fidelis]MDW4823339.1 DEAD/DEAH box helicase [Shewanella fidelis]
MQLRDYQQQSVDAAINHFRTSIDSAVLVLPTGAGKSIVIAELARIAKGRVLVLTHVKELVAQNAEKVGLLTTQAKIYSAGLNQKSTDGKTVVASIQSAVKQPTQFDEPYSLVIIDECHRVSPDEDSQYQLLLTHLKSKNSKLRVLGLTATPYRLDLGWIYRHHYHGKVGNTEKPVFEKCIFELPMRPLIKQGFLSQPKMFDGLSAQYDFSELTASPTGEYNENEVNSILNHCGRATTAIVKQLIDFGASRQGIIIFAATVKHAEEIVEKLASEQVALITAKTSREERDRLINEFKAKKIKYLVNVAVLTTGFDAPHVDLIAILRPTASVSLFQQMVGRGLRIDKNKTECLVIDYAANGYDLFYPEVGQPKPNSKCKPVQVHCPVCDYANIFWGLTDDDGDIIEHFGRRCQAIVETEDIKQQCDFRFRSKSCPNCGEENDIAAKVCQHCQSVLVDPDKRLKEVLQQKHHHLFKCQSMLLEAQPDRLLVRYIDLDGNDFCRFFKMQTPAQIRALFALFILPHSRTPGMKHPKYKEPQQLVNDQTLFRKPDLLLLKKGKKGWELMDTIFDYKGRYQTDKANFE